MRWGKRQQKQKHQSSSSSPQKHQSSSSSPSLLSNMLSFSWISKLKQMAGKPTKPKQHTRPNIVPRSPPPARSASHHLSVAGDAPRRLSIGDDETHIARARTTQARAILRSARHNSVGDLEFRPFSSCRPDFEFSESLRRPTTSDSERSDPLLLRRRPPPRRRRSRPMRADVGLPSPLPLQPIKSFSGRVRPRSKPKIRVQSPRPSTSSRAVTTRRTAGGGLESFAVVKCSRDPQRDFRESMVEMIWERGMGRPEELERLLACYLSLNSDEHHDVIVKVFRQVWFDLNPTRFASDDMCG